MTEHCRISKLLQHIKHRLVPEEGSIICLSSDRDKYDEEVPVSDAEYINRVEDEDNEALSSEEVAARDRSDEQGT